MNYGPARVAIHVCFWLICACMANQLQRHVCVCLYLCVYLKVYLSFFQSQQPLEDLDAQLRRALSPETVPVSTHTQVDTHMSGYSCLDIILLTHTVNTVLIQWHRSVLFNTIFFCLHADPRPLIVAYLHKQVCIVINLLIYASVSIFVFYLCV